MAIITTVLGVFSDLFNNQSAAIIVLISIWTDMIGLIKTSINN